MNLQALKTNTKPSTYFFTIGRKQLRSEILKEARNQLEQNLKYLKQIGFVSAAIDNGTINGRHFLFTCLLNPNAGLYPIYYDSRTEKHFSINDFIEYGNQLFDELKNYGVTLIAFVGDNLRSQVGGLAHWKSGSLQSQSEVPDIKSLLYVPCCCHVLNLVLIDLERESYQFSCLKYKLNELVVILRKTEVVKAVGHKIPDIPETRWVYIYVCWFVWLTKSLIYWHKIFYWPAKTYFFNLTIFYKLIFILLLI